MDPLFRAAAHQRSTYDVSERVRFRAWCVGGGTWEWVPLAVPRLIEIASGWDAGGAGGALKINAWQFVLREMQTHPEFLEFFLKFYRLCASQM